MAASLNQGLTDRRTYSAPKSIKKTIFNSFGQVGDLYFLCVLFRININTVLHKIQKIRNLTDSTYIIRMDKNKFEFRSGQYLSLGLPDDVNMREYSIYSGVDDPFLEVLIKEVQEGDVSVLLKKAKVGQLLNVEGPYGFFTLREKDIENHEFLFLATGTGISPFHSFIQSNPNLNYTLIHGIRFTSEAYEKETYSKERYFSATSKDSRGSFQGRLTGYLKTINPKSDTLCYLCGNVDMIHDAYDILQEKGIPVDQIHSEVYF